METTFLKIYLIIYRELAPKSQFIKSLLVAQRLLGYNDFVRKTKRGTICQTELILRK